jgi:ubiquinone/menaquinone biosynthesis C-methylase UbiE
MNFWDFCAPLYDFFQRFNGKSYIKMLETVREVIPQNAAVLEVAAGTGAISLKIADKAEAILCTDLSERMLVVARKKAKKRGNSNIRFNRLDIFDIKEPDNAFDVVIAGLVLHLVDEPEKAAAELRRVAKNIVILPMIFTADLRGLTKLKIKLYRLFGFAPRIEFNLESYTEFLPKIGFKNCEIIAIDGEMPMAVAVWRGGENHESIHKTQHD